MLVKRLLLSAVAISLWAGAIAAQDLRFEFTIDAQISGSRPWDGTASSSSALDNIVPDDFASDIIGDDSLLRRGIGTGLDIVLNPAIDAAVDEGQATVAPPDPYLCIIGVFRQLRTSLGEDEITSGQYSVTCTPRNLIKPNRLQFTLDLPENIASLPAFGVVLVDDDLRDSRNHDELIGFGLYIAEDVRTAIVGDAQGVTDPTVLPMVQRYEAELPKIVEHHFDRQRTAIGSGHVLEMEKLSAATCGQSCRFGDATLTIKNTPGGW